MTNPTYLDVAELVNEIEEHTKDFHAFFETFARLTESLEDMTANYNEAVRLVHRMDDCMREVGAIRDHLEAMLGHEPLVMTRHRILNALRRKLWTYPDVTDEKALAAARELLR